MPVVLNSKQGFKNYSSRMEIPNLWLLFCKEERKVSAVRRKKIESSECNVCGSQAHNQFLPQKSALASSRGCNKADPEVIPTLGCNIFSLIEVQFLS